MPQFKWRGVTITGDYKRGVSFAPSTEHLDDMLLRRGIACTYATPKKRRYVLRGVTRTDIIHLFTQLEALLRAGILLPDACMLVAGHVEHPQLQDYMSAVSARISKGMPLREALQKGSLLDPLAVHMMHVGYHTNTLADAVATIAQHTESQHRFFTALWSALIMPIVTMLFIMLLVWGVFAFLLPQIASIFTSFNKPLPVLTQWLLWVSVGMRSWYALVLCGFIFFVSFLFWFMCKKTSLQRIYTRLWLALPYVRTLYKEYISATSLQALASLMRSGLHIKEALDVLCDTYAGTILGDEYAHIAREVHAGASLSTALASTMRDLFLPDVIAVVAAGEESNALAAMMTHAAHTYNQRFVRRLTRITTLVQPVLILVLGVIIAALVVAVYMPIMQMADLV